MLWTMRVAVPRDTRNLAVWLSAVRYRRTELFKLEYMHNIDK
jgi:hypothetical protein